MRRMKSAPPPAYRLSVAPMLDWTDRHARFLLRQISRHTLLYTEMVTTGALLRGDTARWLQHHTDEYPVALQLGGSDPDALARCAALGEAWNYDEINLNVGCPSDRVSAGRFGACLMAEPALVADCVAAMRRATALPVTVKTRLGIDDQDSPEFLYRFIDTVAAAGCSLFILHARKAWLKGLSPRENRDIPPLHYERVHAVKARYPELTVILNGGIGSLQAAAEQLQQVDGVMIGRAVSDNPWLLAEADRRIFHSDAALPDYGSVTAAYRAYLQEELKQDCALHHLTRPLLNLFHGLPGARRFRRHLSENAHKSGAGLALFDEALAQLQLPGNTH